MKTQDEQHLDILSILHYVFAGLMALFGFFPLIYVAMGYLIVSGNFGPPSARNPPPPPEMGYILIGFGLVFLSVIWLMAGLCAFAGRCLKKRKNRVFCIVVAGISCLNAPLGTILGVFTIIVLMKERVIVLFDGPLDTDYLEALPPDRDEVRVMDHQRRRPE